MQKARQTILLNMLEAKRSLLSLSAINQSISNLTGNILCSGLYAKGQEVPPLPSVVDPDPDPGSGSVLDPYSTGTVDPDP